MPKVRWELAVGLALRWIISNRKAAIKGSIEPVTGTGPVTGEERTVITPVAPLRLEAGVQGLARLRWLGPADARPLGSGSILLERAEAALRCYFQGAKGWQPCLPLDPLPSTPFQRRVWRAICAIPPGEVRTYGELARWIGSGARAVGNATAANPWPLLVPCHRVVARGGLGGYLGHSQGPGLPIKAWLLRHEGVPWSKRGGPVRGSSEEEGVGLGS